MPFTTGTDENLYPLKEGARWVGVSYLTAWYWVRDGKLPAIRIGRGWVVRESDLLATANAPKSTAQGRPRIGTGKAHKVA